MPFRAEQQARGRASAGEGAGLGQHLILGSAGGAVRRGGTQLGFVCIEMMVGLCVPRQWWVCMYQDDGSVCIEMIDLYLL